MKGMEVQLLHEQIHDLCYEKGIPLEIHWRCLGDWGLSCDKNYYNCSNNGFDKACEQFER